MPIEQVLQEVRREVSMETKGLQIPCENTSLLADFVFLKIKNSKNWAAMLNTVVPDGKMEFRFFTPTKCDGTQNNENHMNRKLANIFGIKLFK